MSMRRLTWIPCLLRDDDRYVVRARTTGDDVQTTGSKIYLHYRSPMAPFTSNQRLFCSAVRIGINDADQQNSIYNVRLIGVSHMKGTPLWTQDVNLTSQADNQIKVNPQQNLSSFPVTDLRLTARTSVSGKLRIAYVMLGCYYR